MARSAEDLKVRRQRYDGYHYRRDAGVGRVDDAVRRSAHAVGRVAVGTVCDEGIAGEDGVDDE